MSIDTRVYNGNFIPVAHLSPELAHAEFMDITDGMNMGEKYQLFRRSSLDAACIAAVDSITYDTKDQATEQFTELSTQAYQLTSCLRNDGQTNEGWLEYAFPSTAIIEIDPHDLKTVAVTLKQNHFVTHDRVRMSEETSFKVSYPRGVTFGFSQGKVEQGRRKIEGHTRINLSKPESIERIKEWLNGDAITLPERRYFFLTRE